MKHISVLNYNENCVCVNIAPGKSLKFDESSFGQPTTIPLTLDEIKYVNNGNAFKTGLLEFPEDIEDELYEELRIDKNKVLKLRDISNILLNPTKSGLQKIVGINNLSDFDRVRGQFQKLKNDGYKLTLDIANIIDTRTKELFNNQIRTNIVIDDADIPANDSRVQELERQLEEMKMLVQQALSNGGNNSVQNVNSNKDDIVEVPKKKSPGRPRKTNS